MIRTIKKLIVIASTILILASISYAGWFGFLKDPAMPPFPTGASGSGLLLESGGYLRLEDNTYLLLE